MVAVTLYIHNSFVNKMCFQSTSYSEKVILLYTPIELHRIHSLVWFWLVIFLILSKLPWDLEEKVEFCQLKKTYDIFSSELNAVVYQLDGVNNIKFRIKSEYYLMRNIRKIFFKNFVVSGRQGMFICIHILIQISEDNSQLSVFSFYYVESQSLY